MNIIINGVSVPLKEIEDDVIAAKDKGLSYKWAFCPETVQGLIDRIKELESMNDGLVAACESIQSDIYSLMEMNDNV